MLKKTIGLILAVVVITAAIWYLESLKPSTAIPDGNADIAVAQNQTAAQKEGKYSRAKEIVSPAGYLNTDNNLSIQSLIGKKVILVDFWTYSCINCQRTLPYLTSWYEKYRDQGLEIVGIHTPEFEFEKKYDNVRQAIEQYGIDYPVVQDNDYATWRAYGNRYWPRKYLIDIDGFIVYDHIGEGAYEQTERVIQKLLNERKSRLGEEGSVSSSVTSLPADETKAKSPEIYFGAGRNTYLGQGKANTVGVQNFTAPARIRANALYLTGTWDIQPEYARNTSKNSAVIFRYQAQNVFIVANADNGARVRVLIDGLPVPENIAGTDVVNGLINVSDSRLYKVIEAGEYAEHTLELIIEDGNVDIYTFTFG